MMRPHGDTYWAVVEPIWEKVSIYDGPEVFLHAFGNLTAPQQHLFASHWCQSEIRNGGFHQFFENPTGVLAPEAVVGFREIGLPRCAELLEQAMEFFGASYPREQEIRAASLDEIDEDSDRREDDPFCGLDDQFFEAIADDGYDRAADQYALRTTAA